MFVKILCLALLSVVVVQASGMEKRFAEAANLWAENFIADLKQEFEGTGGRVARSPDFWGDLWDSIRYAWADFVVGPSSACEGLFDKPSKSRWN